MELFLISLLNGLVHGMLLFMLASGLTLIFSMMGVLNFAHASLYMLGAYLAYEVSRHVGFWAALGHNVPRVFTLVFAGGSALAGLAGVIGGNYLVTEPAMALTMGPIVFVVVVFGGLGSVAGCFIASMIMGFVQTFAVVLDVAP